MNKKLNKKQKCIMGTLITTPLALAFLYGVIRTERELPKVLYYLSLVEKIEKRIDENNDGVKQPKEIADLLKNDFGYERKIDQNKRYEFGIADNERVEVMDIYSYFGRFGPYRYTLITLPRKTVEKLVE